MAVSKFGNLFKSILEAIHELGGSASVSGPDEISQGRNYPFDYIESIKLN